MAGVPFLIDFMKTQFRAISKVHRKGPFAASFVELPQGVEFQTPFVISISRATGNAVQRNKVKRLVKGFFLNSGAQNQQLLWPTPSDSLSSSKVALWLRFHRHNKISSFSAAALRAHLQGLTRELNHGKTHGK